MDVTEQTFQSAVIDRSHTLPIVVDFWAEWCGPCRQLGPVLEQEAAARAGKLELVKVDTDANPGLSSTYRIQGIPAVKAFQNGKVGAEFVGAQPPSQVARFMDSLLPSEADALIAAGDEASLRRAAELEPSRAGAVVPLARILHARGEGQRALRLLAAVPGSFQAEGLAARIELERSAAEKAGNGNATEAGSDLGSAFAALDRGQHAEALELLLSALPAADGTRDDVRRVIVGLLDELGVEHPLAREGRRRLAAALY